MKWLFLTLRVGLAAVFLYAGLIKASASAQFALTLAPFTFIPGDWLPLLATILPGLEIAAGLLILPGPTKKIGAALILLLCLMFCAILAWALANDIIVACSCFGRDEPASAFKMQLTLARDVLLGLAAAAVFFEDGFRFVPRNPDTAQKTPASG